MLSIILIYLKLMLIDALFIATLYLVGIDLLWSVIIGFTIFWGSYVLYRKFNINFQRAKWKKFSKPFDQKVKVLHEKEFKFRDLNKNGMLDKYEDSRLSVEERTEDLLSQMTVEEKAGLLFNHFTFVKDPNELITKQDEMYGTFPEYMMYKRNMNTFTLFGGGITPKQTAIITNKIQEMAEATRLGIPVTICTDPRHHYDAGVGAGAAQSGISRWPEQLGLAATRDMKVIEDCGKVVAKELRVQGIHVLLGPMADTATSPMWGRSYGTFGDHYQLVGDMTATFIKACQGDLDNENVLCQVKHFPGGGPEKDGWDSHFPYGTDQIYPTDRFDEHLEPFKKAIDCGVAQIMPYYSKPMGLKDVEEVGFNFNKGMITDLLKNELGFKGVIGTDFSIIIGTKHLCFDLLFPKVWGVEKLSYEERLEKAFNAGVDQIGGETCSHLLVKLVKKGKLSEERINDSCRKVLHDKFKLGLFDQPYVDVEEASKVCGSDEHMGLGFKAQEKSYMLLKNENNILPLKRGSKIYCENLTAETLKGFGELVGNIEDADVVVIRKEAPHIKQYKYIYEGLFKQGRLDFPAKEEASMLEIMNKYPTILDLGLDRPVVFEKLNEKAKAVTGHFGAEEEVFVKLLFGAINSEAKLPFALPKTMDAVWAHEVDRPVSDGDALYPFDFGMKY